MAKVYLVGAGPGAADLLTLRAARLLEKADMVFADALVNPEITTLARRAEIIAVGKRYARHSTAQQFINKRLIDAARRYPIVVRLKGGDPMLFGRGQEEIDELVAAGIEVDVVPGVTAALAASAAMRVSLTRRGLSRSVVFATPRVAADESPSRWVSSIASADTIILYMAASKANDVASEMLAAGKSLLLPVAIVSGASWAKESIEFTTLGALSSGQWRLADDGRPVTLCIGAVYQEALDAAGATPSLVDAPAGLASL